MADMNSVNLIGRLTADAELKYTNGANPMAISNFSLAVNSRPRKGNDKGDVYFIDINLLGKAAESLQQYLCKGRRVAVTGCLKQDRWQGQDGKARSKIYVRAENVQLLGGNGNGGSYGETGDAGYSDTGYSDAGEYSYN